MYFENYFHFRTKIIKHTNKTAQNSLIKNSLKTIPQSAESVAIIRIDNRKAIKTNDFRKITTRNFPKIRLLKLKMYFITC